MYLLFQFDRWFEKQSSDHSLETSHRDNGSTALIVALIPHNHPTIMDQIHQPLQKTRTLDTGIVMMMMMMG